MFVIVGGVAALTVHGNAFHTIDPLCPPLSTNPSSSNLPPRDGRFAQLWVYDSSMNETINARQRSDLGSRVQRPLLEAIHIMLLGVNRFIQTLRRMVNLNTPQADLNLLPPGTSPPSLSIYTSKLGNNYTQSPHVMYFCIFIRNFNTG